jgi:formamidopyrimidine-DNA glycosylase
MPELPDIAAYIAALESRVTGQPLVRVRLNTPFLLRSVSPPIEAIEGHTITELRRVGKRIAFGLDNGCWLVLHLMIAGRLHWKDLGAKLSARRQLAAFDFASGTLLLTEAGTQHRAALHVVLGDDALSEMDPGGVEPFEVSLSEFRVALSRTNHTLKRALTDPRIISGIGNAYSDEILHAAKLSPVAQTQKLDEASWEALYRAVRDTLEHWIAHLTAEAKERFPEEVTAFREGMVVHGRYGKQCTRCGSAIQLIR